MGIIRKKIGNIGLETFKEEAEVLLDEIREETGGLVDTFQFVEDSNGNIAMEVDQDGKILSYRSKTGTKVENVGIQLRDRSKINIADNWSGYVSNDGEYPLCLPEPRCAALNIISDYDLSQLSKEGYHGDGAPDPIDGVTCNIPTEVEFFDMQGNYFKKWTLMSAQGASTMIENKKNIAFDFFDTSVYDSNGKLGKGDTFAIKFGDWVPQDSFHIKAYNNDPTKIKAVCAYDFYDSVLKTRECLEDRTWKKATINASGITSSDANISSVDSLMKEFDNGARCFPKGFPVIVYQNGEFMGIYMWQLKKHRDNYKMNKNNANHIHLDGEIFDLFSYNGNIDWSVFAGESPDSLGNVGDVEVRNPKDLYLMDGTKYNADTNRGEFIDSTSSSYKSSNANHVRTAAVKNALIELSKVDARITAAKDIYEASGKTAEDLAAFKSVFETYFDPANLIDYTIVNEIILNWDSVNHNTQWTTWDGVKWYANMYDTDNTFGSNKGGSTPMAPIHDHMDQRLVMYNTILRYYGEELKARYHQLRNLGIIDANNITDKLLSFQQRINSDYFKKDWELWHPNATPKDSIYRIHKFLKEQIANMDVVYQYQAS